ncbi:winged helix-turn-helix transcriptional regulator [Streptomyces sp. ventii]|uniref:Winged helix-turn-helix transcriptional regulator n=1 Tax=Streptomyces spiramenti TaxID=2720606 RepID=A0ABX1AH50_9ACTN|nr:winged helix-turn-helix transcriptional regulator [Streptomyces spiramenti]
MSHSTRRELLARVTREPATISALAAALDVGKGTVAHHLGVLRSADMVTVTETRQARGGTQHLYSAAPPVAAVPSAAPGHRAAPPLPDAGAQPTAQPLLVLHDLALTEAEVAALRRCLRRVVADAVSEATRPRAGATAGRSVHTVAVDLRRSSADA